LHVTTVGCRANQADTSLICEHLPAGAFRLVATLDEAELALVNSCAVTAEAERDTRKAVRRALAANPRLQVLLIGCAVGALPGIEASLGERVTTLGGGECGPEEIARRLTRLAGLAAPRDEQAVAPVRPDARPRARALLKVQSGCQQGCAYCVVPRARGAERSVAPELAVARAVALRDAGFNEIVLTGVQLGAYGRTLPDRPSLAGLVEALLAAIRPARLRLSSLEPWSLSDELLAVFARHDDLCPHLHLPLQSGADRVLRLMRRPMTATRFAEIVARARAARPGLAIGTDVLLGLPGEDEAAYLETIALLEAVRPSYLHAFSYSPRPGTLAATLPGAPRRDEARARTRQVRALGDRLHGAWQEGVCGEARRVIIESRSRDGARALSDDFLTVLVPGPSDATVGQLRLVRVETARHRGRLVATLLDRTEA